MFWNKVCLLYTSISTAVVDEDNIVFNEHLPDNETGVVADDNNGEIVTHLIVTNNTKGDWTINDVDRFYDIIMWNNPVDYCYGIMVKGENLSSHYIKKDNIMNLIKNELCICKIRLLFDDGG